MRIISGSLRGRDLGSVPDGVRPTSDRVRESLFSALGALEGLRVLDLFAGTGALGLEAYSRGAARVVYVERSRKTARLLSKRLARLGLEQETGIEILPLEALRALKRLRERGDELFDLAFLDPPYAEGDREAVVDALFEAGILSAHARVVVEGPTRHPLRPLAGVRVVDERRYGDTLLTWLEAARPGEG